jgi:hypothetical protein
MRRKSACYMGHMLFENSVAAGTEWSWQPGRASRASESTRLDDDDRVHRTLKRIAKARALLDSQEAAALREAQRIRLWERFGYTSLVDYMERELGYSARSAVDRLRVANAIEALPQVEAALDQGTLSFSAARRLVPIMRADNQEAWLEATQDKSVREIEAMVSGHKPGDMPSDPVDEQARTKTLRFDVSVATAAIVREYQKHRARALGDLVDDDVLIREVFQQALDRVVESRRAASDSSDTATTAPRGRYQIATVVCAECKRGWMNAAGTTTLMDPVELARAQCDCDEIGRVDIVGETRKRAAIPPARKKKVLARDNHRCRVPGCRSTNIDVHHLHPQALGGSHDETNLLTLCEAHHRAVHAGTLGVHGAAPDVTFTFVGASRFATEARAVETKSALVKLGFTKQEASAAVDAVRTHVGDEALSIEEWLKLALAKCPRPTM